MSDRQIMCDIVLSRIAQLGGIDRWMLSHAALLGVCFEVAILERSLDIDLASLTASLRRACAHDVIVVDATDVDRFRFRHALVREAIRATIAPDESRRIHGKIVRAFESLPDVDRHAHRVADHAFAGLLLEKALIYAERAGDDALETRALAEAAHLYRRAMTVADGPTAERRLQAKIAAIERLGYR